MTLLPSSTLHSLALRPYHWNASSSVRPYHWDASSSSDSKVDQLVSFDSNGGGEGLAYDLLLGREDFSSSLTFGGRWAQQTGIKSNMSRPLSLTLDESGGGVSSRPSKSSLTLGLRTNILGDFKKFNAAQKKVAEVSTFPYKKTRRILAS